ncbi:Nonaspanin (TM9SF) [Trypanosoma melophagium]|uniref:Nonaspanin (TM9SF) n=1 Tax=Trypanosoma melophagium TaxID=715481 RepID=UPI003519DA61|nr:Nonaspanin (TM9SF) [Trypanosoma melophagium]
MWKTLFLLISFLCFNPGIFVTGFFYVPGLAPTARRLGDAARLEVDNLHSLTNDLPYPYYDARTPFCPPLDKGELELTRNLGLGALLSGARPEWSSYTFYMLMETCAYVECDDRSRLTTSQVKWMRKLIEKNYRVYAMLDEIPVYSDPSTLSQTECKKGVYKQRRKVNDMQQGFYLGTSSKCTGGPVYLNNHLHFIIQYHTLKPDEVVNYEEKTTTDGTRVQLRKRLPVKKARKTEEEEGDKKKGGKVKDGLLEHVSMMKGDTDTDIDILLGIDEYSNEEDEESALHIIVDVSVQAFSVDWGNVKDGRPDDCQGLHDDNEEKILFENSSLRISDIKAGKYPPLILNHSLTTRSIAWTYTVEWQEQGDLRWGARWEKYFNSGKIKEVSGTHYFFIIYSLLIVLTLTSSVFLILLRALRRDFAFYNSLLEVSKESDFESTLEEHGWKAVSGDVFRLPNYAEDLVVLVASGVQVFFTTAVLILTFWVQNKFSFSGNSIASVLLIQFIFSSLLCGFFAAWLSKSLYLPQRWLTITKFVCGLPGIVFVAFLLCNTVLRLARSTGAVPFMVLVFLAVLWICIFMPLTFIGAVFGFRISVSKVPGPVNPIPRRINTSIMPAFLQIKYILLFSGMTPLAVALFELHLLFTSLFQGFTYNFFGFLFMVFLLWSITCGLTSICVVYYRLCSEDYRWWWLSFAAPSSLGLHLFIFTIFFNLTIVQMTSMAATFLYTMYMSLLTLFYVLCSGAIGFLSAWKFVGVIFATVKVD